MNPNTIIDAALQDLFAGGATPEQIVRRTRYIATQPIKQYFLTELLDPATSPPDYCVSLSVSDWSCISRFFAKPTTEQFHPQRIFQDIAGDVAEAIALQSPQSLILALMLGAKAVQP